MFSLTDELLGINDVNIDCYKDTIALLCGVAGMPCWLFDIDDCGIITW